MIELNKGKLMKCGHVANAFVDHDGTHVYCCHVCADKLEAYESIEEAPNLKGRKAWCTMCGKQTESDTKLAFFDYRPNEKLDRYYCGCCGWD